MKHLVAAALLASFFAACAASTPSPKYVEEKNQAKFGTAKEFREKPDAVLIAARTVLDKLTAASAPAASENVKKDENALFTGWVYSPASRDKFVDYDFNGTMQHKTLAMRRIYGFTVSPSLSGTSVKMSVEEEIQQIDMKSGEPKDWKRVEPEKAAFDMLYRNLKEALSQQ